MPYAPASMAFFAPATVMIPFKTKGRFVPFVSIFKSFTDFGETEFTGGNCELTETVDTSFHKLLVEACGNKYLLHFYEDIAKGLVRYQFHAKRSIMADSSNKLRQTVATQHISIVNSIKLCMPEFARHEMENHMNACTAIILNSIDDM